MTQWHHTITCNDGRGDSSVCYRRAISCHIWGGQCSCDNFWQVSSFLLNTLFVKCL